MQKVFSATALLLIVLWGCTALSDGLHAQNTNQDPPKQAEVTSQTLTDDTLKTTLENMGFEPKKLSKGYLLVTKQDTWIVNVQIVLSPDGRKIGLNANLGKVEDPTSVSAPQWLNLLVSNGDIDPSAFYFDKDQKKLYLHRSFDNRAIVAAVLRKEIDGFTSNVRQTADLWKFAK